MLVQCKVRKCWYVSIMFSHWSMGNRWFLLAKKNGRPDLNHYTLNDKNNYLE